MDAERLAFYVRPGTSFYFELPFLRFLNFILLVVAAFFDFSLSLAYKEIRIQNRLDFEQFRVNQTAKGKNDFLNLLKGIEASRGVILRPFYASAPYPLDQLLFISQE